MHIVHGQSTQEQGQLPARVRFPTEEDAVEGVGWHAQMSTGRLLRGNVMDVGARDAETALFFWPAAWACAVRFYRGEVVGERCMAEVEGAG